MRLNYRNAQRAIALFLVFAAPLVAHTAMADAPAVDKPPNPNDLLGNITVTAQATQKLPKIAVLPSLASDIEDVTLRNVVQRDLDLCGEFEVLPDSAAPEGLYLSDSPIDIKAWAGKGVEAVVKVVGKKAGADKAELRAEVVLLAHGAKPVFNKSFVVPSSAVREESHRVADLVIGALTGQNGGFASRMTFVMGTGSARRVFVIDADGHDAQGISPPGHVAIAPAFGKNGQLYYAASVNNDIYKIYDSTGKVIPLPVKGSVYGIAFSKDHEKVALSMGVGSTLKVFLGSDFSDIKPAGNVGLALHPAFTPSGKLAFSGEGRWGQRIYVEDKPISPDGLFASSPVFCNHPNGVRAIFAVGVGKDTDLVSTSERGGDLARLTQSQGRNSYPACSPDGRLVAFFSTRSSSEGPGLYIMRIDGGRPKRISPLLGDSLRWDRLPPGQVDALAAQN